MKLKLIIISFLSILLISCFNIGLDETSKLIISPSKKYLIQLSVNNSDKNKDNYGYICVKLYDKHKKLLSELNTKAGDYNKWAIDWNDQNDTLIMSSNDIGNYGWKITNRKFEPIKLNTELNKRAEKIFNLKYSN